MWSTGHMYKTIHHLHQAVELINNLCTGIGPLWGYDSPAKPKNHFFALGLTGRIEEGIKSGIETQASGTMTVASECLTQKVAKLLVRDGTSMSCTPTKKGVDSEVRSKVPKEDCLEMASMWCGLYQW